MDEEAIVKAIKREVEDLNTLIEQAANAGLEVELVIIKDSIIGLKFDTPKIIPKIKKIL